MKWRNFTSDYIAGLNCKHGKKQSIYWDGKTPGLGLRVTSAGTKSYIFQTDLHGKTIRMTIGDIRTWKIGKAQKEATRLKAMTDQGIDPRKVIADEAAAKLEKEAAKKLHKVRATATLGMVWPEYIEARKTLWSDLHLRDHEKMIHAGGEKRTRSNKLTEPGALASLAKVNLIELTPERVTEWAKVEAATRPTQARLALRLLRAFLFWCARHPTYRAIVTSNSAQSKEARESLGKAKAKHDVLQREQLPAWFKAVKQIGNPVINAYLQALLLTGARRNELAALRWQDVDFQWNSLTLHDKVEGLRVIPLTPYVAQLLAGLPRRMLTAKQLGNKAGKAQRQAPNEFVFSSPTSAKGCIHDPSIAHRKACAVAGLDMTLHGLRRSFATLCEWTETPAGIAAQIQGHAPQGVREQNYIRRPLDLLRMWHVKIEAWILNEAGIKFVPVQAGLRVVATK
jgi:integrase